MFWILIEAGGNLYPGLNHRSAKSACIAALMLSDMLVTQSLKHHGSPFTCGEVCRYSCQLPAYSHGPKQIFVFNKGLYLDFEIIKGTLCYPTTLWGTLAGTEHFLLSCRWLLIHACITVHVLSITEHVLPFAQRPLSIIEIQCSLLNKTFLGGTAVTSQDQIKDVIWFKST